MRNRKADPLLERVNNTPGRVTLDFADSPFDAPRLVNFRGLV